MPQQPEFQERLGSIEELIRKIEAAADPNLRTIAQELVQLVMDLHGSGIERMMDLIREAGDRGEAVIRKMGNDELVSSLLILYGLHPVNMEARVTRAVEKVNSRLRSHGADVELLSVEDGAIRLRLHAKSQGCGSSPQSVKEIVEEAVYQAAPDLTAMRIEGAEERQSFVPLEMLRDGQPVPLAVNGSSLAAGRKGGM